MRAVAAVVDIGITRARGRPDIAGARDPGLFRRGVALRDEKARKMRELTHRVK